MLDERIPPFKEGELQITTAERIVTEQIGDNVTLRAENEALKAEIEDLTAELKDVYGRLDHAEWMLVTGRSVLDL